MEDPVIQEQEIFSEGIVKIINKRAILGAKTYSISNITSVTNVEIKHSVAIPLFLIILGAILIIVYVLLLFSALKSTGFSLYLGLALLIAGFFWYRMKRGSDFVVRIGSASGEVDGMSSSDRDFISSIVKAINDAIVMG